MSHEATADSPRADIMRMLVRAQEIGTAVDGADRSVLAMAAVSLAQALDPHAARWRFDGLQLQ